jgi:hypothetical protein
VVRHRFFGTDAAPAIAAMTVTRATHDERQAFVRSAFAKYHDDPRVRLIDFTSALCDDRICTPGTTREPYYVDEDHLNAAGAVLVSGEIAKQSVLAHASR